MSRAILWFRNDLRLSDNMALTAALAEHDEVLPVLVIDPVQHGPSPFGFERSGNFRRRFMHEGVRDLAAQLRAKGSALNVRVGGPAAMLQKVAAIWKADVVHSQRLFGWEEQQHAVSSVLDLRLHAPNTLLLPGDLPFTMDKLPHVFTAFRTRVEKSGPVREVLPEPDSIPSPAFWGERPLDQAELPYVHAPADPRGVMTFTDGRSAGLERFKTYLWENHAL